MQVDSAVLLSQPVTFSLWRPTGCGDGAESDPFLFRNELLRRISALLKLSNNLISMQAVPLKFDWRNPTNTTYAMGDEQVITAWHIWT